MKASSMQASEKGATICILRQPTRGDLYCQLTGQTDCTDENLLTTYLAVSKCQERFDIASYASIGFQVLIRKLFILKAVITLGSSCFLGLLLFSGCVTTANPTANNTVPPDLNLPEARQKLYSNPDLSLQGRGCLALPVPAFPVPLSIRLKQPVLGCFSPFSEEESNFATLFASRLEKAVTARKGLRVAKSGEPVQADLLVEVILLYNGAKYPGMVNRALLAAVTRDSGPQQNFAVASCNVFLLKPDAPDVLHACSTSALYQPALADSILGSADRFPQVAATLANNVADRIIQFTKHLRALHTSDTK